MMTWLKPHQQILLFLCAALLLAACAPQEPIIIYVTPTPQAEAAQATLVNTAVPPEASVTEASPTATVTATPTVALSPQPTITFVGPIVGPGYTPPPTQTPLPPSATPETAVPPAATTPAPPAATTTPAPFTPMPGLDADLIGVQVHSLLDQDAWNEVLRRVEQLGVGWAKVQIDWALLQPGGPDQISEDFRRQELYIESLHQRGVKVLVSVAKAPGWSRSVTTESGPPDDPQALVGFLTLMMREFGDAIEAVEVWNEPNLQREWQGQPLTGASYMRYFAPAYEALRAYSDQMLTDAKQPRPRPMIVVTAGLAPTGTSDVSVDDRDYLQQMYDAGLGDYADVMVGVHPYSWGNPPDVPCCNAVEGQGWDDDPHFFFADNMADYRAIIERGGQPDSQMMVTEFGWATWDGFPGAAPEEWMTYNDKWAQANYTMRAFEIGQQAGYIGPMILWNLNFGTLDGQIEARDERAAYSLLVPLNPAERPLFWMLYDAVRPDVALPRYD
jgi:hypothetical protein